MVTVGLYLILLINEAPSSSRVPPQIGGVLDQYAKTLQESRCYHVRSKTFREVRDSQSLEVSRSIAQHEFFRDGSKVNLYMDNFRRIPAADDGNLPAFHRTLQHLWNEKVYYRVFTGDSVRDSYVMQYTGKSYSSNNIIAESYFGAPLEGYFLQDQDDLLTIFREELPSGASVREDLLDGTRFYLIEADIPKRGRYRIWFDPERGCHVCRAEVTREVRDGPTDERGRRTKKPPRKLVALRFVLDDIHFEPSGEVWVPMSGQWHVIRIYQGGDTQTLTYHHVCLQAERSWDPSQIGDAFRPQIRDGTVVYTDGKSTVHRDVWINGDAQPDVDWDTLQATDAAINRFTAELTEEGRVLSLLSRTGQPDQAKVTPQPGSGGRIAKGRGGGSLGYCGLYCMYAALRISGEDVDFLELRKPEYMQSGRGSSLFELKQLAMDHGLYAQSVGNLTVADLTASPYALVLHMKRTFKSPYYDHYGLFLGMEGGNAVLYDPPNLGEVPLSSLVARWNGVALAISSKPIDVAPLVQRGRRAFFLCCAGALTAVLMIRAARRFFPSHGGGGAQRRIRQSLVQGMALGCVVSLTALAYHLTRNMSLLGKTNASHSVREAHLADFLPRIRLARVKGLLANSTVFVDARRRADYDAGHLPGAINLPVDANDSDWKRIIPLIPRDCQVVCYCQSQRCPFAGRVAEKLLHDDFTNIAILKGGWYEWSEYSGKGAAQIHGGM